MSTRNVPMVKFLKELMRRRKLLPSHLASVVCVSHVTAGRWISGTNIPSPKSCYKLANYSGTPVEKILSIAGHLPEIPEMELAVWPEFREYALKKYPNELDEDLITMIEDLIELRRHKRHGDSRKDSKMGS